MAGAEGSRTFGAEEGGSWALTPWSPQAAEGWGEGVAVAAEDFFDGLGVEREAVVTEVALGFAGGEFGVDAVEPAEGAGVLLGDPGAGPGAEFVAEVEVVAEDAAGEAPIGLDPGDEVVFAELDDLDDDAGPEVADVGADPRLTQAGLGFSPDGRRSLPAFLGTLFPRAVKRRLGLPSRHADSRGRRREHPREEVRQGAEGGDLAAAEAAPEFDHGWVAGGVDDEVGGLGVGADDEVVFAVAVREARDGEELEVEGAVAEGGLEAIGEAVEGQEVGGVGAEEGAQ